MTDSAGLRRKAEQIESSQASINSDLDEKREEHQLQVYKIELDMQNEELKQAIQTLEEHERHLRDIIRDSPAGYFHINQEGRFLEVNDAWLRIHGYDSADEVIGKHYSITQLEGDSTDSFRHVAELLRSPDVLLGDYPHLRKDGSVGYHMYSAYPVVHTGKVVGVEWFINDTTERMRALTALEKREELLRRTQFLTHTGSWEWIVSSQTAIWTEETYRIHGLEPGKLFLDANAIQESLNCYLPDDRPAIQELFQRCVEQGQSYDIELPFINVLGREMWVRTFAEPVIEYGQVVRVVGFIMDLTERKKAEQVIIQSERDQKKLVQELQTILNTSPVGICCLKNRKVIWANNAFDRTFGYQPGTTQLLDTLTFYPDKDSYEQYAKKAYSIITQGGTYSEDILMKNKDGSLFWCNITGHAIATDNLQEGSIWIIQDINERKQVEEQMRTLTRHYQLATSSARLGIWDWNINENTMSWDDRMFELYGTTKETFSNNLETWMNCLHPDDKEKTIADCQAALQGEREFDTIFRVLHRDGAVRYLKANGLVIRGAEGTVERMIGVTIDISDLKQAEDAKLKLEQQLLQAQKMESIGTLAGGIAHDFNNILTAIVGYGNLALMMSADTDKQRLYIQNMLDASERAVNLTKDLLLFSRKQASNKIPLNLNDIVTKVEKFLVKVISEDIEYKTSIYAEPLPVMADPHQLEQVLMNLATNAGHAMPNGGLLKVTTDIVTTDGEGAPMSGLGPSASYALMTVTDTGEGMDEATLQHIFEPFFTTKEVGKGTGLGLAVVYGIVKQHDGLIKVDSEPGKGSTFRIYLPLITPAIITAPPIEKNEVVAGGMETILLAEDDELVRNLTKTILTDHGYTVIEAVDGLDAVSKFSANSRNIDLLLFDMIMPHMNGIGAYNEIRKTSPAIKVIFQSGYAPETINQKVTLKDGAHLLDKPSTPLSLLRKVRAVLDGA